MKKILFVLLIAVFCVSLGYAEQSAQTYSGNKLQRFDEQQVFIDCYNGSGADISSNYVVIIDTSATNTASGSTLGTYINTTTTANDARVLGVTENTIANGTVGRVCVRGPHKCYIATIGTLSAGATLSSVATAGSAGIPTTTSGIPSGEFAILLQNTPITGSSAAAPNGLQGTQGGFKIGDGTSNYWVWIGNVGSN